MNEEKDKREKRRRAIKNVLVRFCLPLVSGVVIWLVVQSRYQLNCPISVLLNIEGTLLLAFAFSVPVGTGPNRIKWWLYESMDYGDTPSFSYPNFYLGIFALLIGLISGAVQ